MKIPGDSHRITRYTFSSHLFIIGNDIGIILVFSTVLADQPVICGQEEFNTAIFPIFTTVIALSIECIETFITDTVNVIDDGKLTIFLFAPCTGAETMLHRNTSLLMYYLSQRNLFAYWMLMTN